jgi:hypothetical protein
MGVIDDVQSKGAVQQSRLHDACLPYHCGSVKRNPISTLLYSHNGHWAGSSQKPHDAIYREGSTWKGNSVVRQPCQSVLQYMFGSTHTQAYLPVIGQRGHFHVGTDGFTSGRESERLKKIRRQ